MSEDVNLIQNLNQSIITANDLREKGATDEAVHALTEVIATIKQQSNLTRIIDTLHKGEIIAPDSIPSSDRDFLRVYIRAIAGYSLVESDKGSDLAKAETLARQAITFCEAIGDADDGKLLGQLADIHRKQGKTQLAGDELLRSVALLEQHGNARGAADNLGSFAHMLSAQGKLDQALEFRQKGLDIVTAHGDEVAINIFKGDKAKDLYRMGRLDEAEALVREAYPTLDERHPRCGSYSHRVLGDILLAKGKPEEARAAYMQAIDTTNQHCAAMGQVGLGWLELQAGNAKAAEAAFIVATDLDYHGEAALKTEALAGVAIAQGRQGANSKAAETLSAALAEIEGNDNLYAAGHVLTAQAIILRSAGRDRQAEEASQKATAAFEACAKPLVGLGRSLATSTGPSLLPRG